MTVLQSAVTKMGNGHLNTVLVDSEGGHYTSTSSNTGQRSRFVSANTLSIALCVVTLSLGLGILCLEVYRVREVWSLQTEVEWLKKEVQILKEDFSEEIEEEEDEEENEDDVMDDDSPEALIRSRRQAYGPPTPRTDGVPVLNSSYGISHLNQSSEGLRVYESLLVNEGHGEPRSQGIIWESTPAPLQDHHKKSPLWVPRNERRKFPNAHRNTQIASSKSFFGRHKKSLLPDIRTTELPRIMERRSRVKQTGRAKVSRPYIRVSTDENPPRPLKRTSGQNGKIMMKVVQPTDGVVAATPTGHTLGGRRPLVRRTKRRRGRRVNGKKKNRKRKHKEEEDRNLLKNIIDETNPQKGERPGITAAHFKGDTSNYSLHHQHYTGNGRVRTTDGIFTNWKKSSWMDSMKFTNFYPIDGGTVTVLEAGLYFIYAQINYVDTHDLNGFEVYINSDPYLQCTTMTHTASGTTKTNTCYTGGATYLAAGDKVSVRDVEAMRYAIFTSPKSFFGLIKLSDIKI